MDVKVHTRPKLSKTPASVRKNDGNSEPVGLGFIPVAGLVRWFLGRITHTDVDLRVARGYDVCRVGGARNVRWNGMDPEMMY